MCARTCMRVRASESDRGVQGLFFHPPVKCFTLAAAWKGSLIEKLSGRGICHPPCCSVTTLIHAQQPNHNREVSHSASQQEAGPLHGRGEGEKGGMREGGREGKEGGGKGDDKLRAHEQTSRFQVSSHISVTAQKHQRLTCLPVLFVISVWE